MYKKKIYLSNRCQFTKCLPKKYLFIILSTIKHYPSIPIKSTKLKHLELYCYHFSTVAKYLTDIKTAVTDSGSGHQMKNDRHV